MPRAVLSNSSIRSVRLPWVVSLIPCGLMRIACPNIRQTWATLKPEVGECWEQPPKTAQHQAAKLELEDLEGQQPASPSQRVPLSASDLVAILAPQLLQKPPPPWLQQLACLGVRPGWWQWWRRVGCWTAGSSQRWRREDGTEKADLILLEIGKASGKGWNKISYERTRREKLRGEKASFRIISFFKRFFFFCKINVTNLRRLLRPLLASSLEVARVTEPQML